MVGRALEQFCNLLRVLLGGLMGALAIPVAMQVLSRYTGLVPTYLWTEELSTFIFIWIVMIGSMVAVWDGTHFDVRVVPDAKSPLGRLIQQGVVLVLILLFAILFAIYGIEYAEFGNNQRSVMMRANLMVIYISVPVAGLIWAVFASYRLWQEIDIFRRARKAQT
ncbi:TRAP transporter small permease [Roseobacter weihaiensis]|uniref:TRAP transporter small permease n=1 Tax=Roseobacter weihaiensis TaxID=2763262 RepID=UPI001D0AF0D6|nr:TRAP transporter small permease subunit [Roseobacter sp. H9]